MKTAQLNVITFVCLLLFATAGHGVLPDGPGDTPVRDPDQFTFVEFGTTAPAATAKPGTGTKAAIGNAGKQTTREPKRI